jgi:hypothetical protein
MVVDFGIGRGHRKSRECRTGSFPVAPAVALVESREAHDADDNDDHLKR